MSNCNHDCNNCSEKCSSKNEQSFKIKNNPLSNVKKVIGIVSGKGGVGKSTITSLLAVSLNKKGYTTAILDGDITGASIAKVFGVKEEVKALNENTMLPVISRDGVEIMSINFFLEDETDPVVWRGPVLAGALKQFWSDVAWGEVDFMFVDMPPGTGDVPLTAFQSLPLDGIVIVTTPQELVGSIVTKAFKMAQMMKIPVLGLVENMSYFICPKCNEKHYIYGKGKSKEVAKAFNVDVVSELPITPKYANLCDQGKIEELDDEVLKEIIDNLTK